MPNPKDALGDELNQEVCDGRITLAQAQRAIATNWVRLAHPRNTTLPAGQTSTPSSTPAATCSADAQYDTRYGDWDVYVHSNQPDQAVTVSGAAKTRTWHTDSSGYADVYFDAGRSAVGRADDRTGGSGPPARRRSDDRNRGDAASAIGANWVVLTSA